MKKITTYTTIFLAALLLTFACKKEKPELNISDHDPCACASEVSAEFKIEELATHIPEVIWDETDTTNYNVTVRFTAKEDGAQYKWYIGSQIYTTRSVSRIYGDEWKETDVPITLVVTKQPNSICFPNDDGYDSIKKFFHVSQYPIFDPPNAELYHPLEGTYRVWGPTVDDSIEVTFNMRLFSQFTHTRKFDIYNPDGSGVSCVGDEDRNAPINYLGFRRVSFGAPQIGAGSFLCGALGGVITRDENNKVTLDLWANLGWPTTFIPNSWSFKGRKIN